MKCQQCGVEVNAESVYCHKCGARIVADEPLFSANPESDERSFPPNTGASAAPPVPEPRPRSRRDAPEEELWQGTYSPRAMLGMWVLDGAAVIAGIALAVMFPAYWFAPIGAVFLFSLLLFLQLMYRRLSISYRLTTQRFFHQRGVLSRTTDRIEMIDIDDITCSQGPIERMFGVGSIRVTSSDRTDPELWIHGVDDVQQVALMMDDARREERIRRGIHIESV
jgi:membrane protein YdbS with pleckstrin-like domain